MCECGQPADVGTWIQMGWGLVQRDEDGCKLVCKGVHGCAWLGMGADECRWVWMGENWRQFLSSNLKPILST